MDEQQLIKGTVVTDLSSGLVRAEKAEESQQQIEARRIEQVFVTFIRHFNDNRPILSIPKPPEPGVVCDQYVLPGMRRHWGELRACATHPPDKAPFTVCRGCRLHQYVHLSISHDRQNVANRGARAPVCADCATQAIRLYGVGYRGCICDSQWTCYRCREI